MNRLFKFLNLFLLLCTIGLTTVYAQNNNNNANVTESGNPEKKIPRDGIYDKVTTNEKRILDYKNLHEKDVLWEKRVTRVIDLREKRNHFFSYKKEEPSKTFMSILLDAGQKGEIAAYRSDVYDVNFTDPYTKGELINLGVNIDTLYILDENLNEIPQIVVNKINPLDVIQYKVMEVYFFEEESSDLSVRILGIAPVRNLFSKEGNLIGTNTMFWVYYPDIRKMLAKIPAYNENNDRDGFSWEDVFELRLFSSYITKESNVHDRRIQDYKNGIDILYESDNIKNSIFHFEHDVWDY